MVGVRNPRVWVAIRLKVENRACSITLMGGSASDNAFIVQGLEGGPRTIEVTANYSKKTTGDSAEYGSTDLVSFTAASSLRSIVKVGVVFGHKFTSSCTCPPIPPSS